MVAVSGGPVRNSGLDCVAKMRTRGSEVPCNDNLNIFWGQNKCIRTWVLDKSHCNEQG